MFRLLVSAVVSFPLGAAILGAGLGASLGACNKKDPEANAPQPATERAADPAAGPVAEACAKAKPDGAVAWIEDDYAAALACAKARGVPLVLDFWAPWCHTCLSMKSTVFADPSLAEEGARFVFAALDTDKEVNAAAVAKFPLSAWPTFYVVGHDETVLSRFVGAASLAQFRAFLDAGRTALAGADGAARHLLAAERAIAAKDLATAERELTAALDAAPAGWVRTPDALVSLLHTRRKRGDAAGCLELAERRLDDTGHAASATDFVGLALDCASSIAATDAARATAFRERAIARLSKLLDDPRAQLSTDDRSDAMVYLRTVLDEVGRTSDAHELAERQRALLADAIAKAAEPRAAMTFNWQLAEVCVYLGRPLDAVPALEASAKALPDEYDPPARLGWVLLKGGRLDEAARWTDKAIALAYGPRKARVLGQRAEIAAAQGDVAAERTYREQVVALWESLPPGQANPDALAKARHALARLAPPAVTP